MFASGNYTELEPDLHQGANAAKKKVRERA